MSKTGSRIALIAGALVLVVGIGLAVVLGQLGRLIEKGVESGGPPVTGTDVSLGSARVSIFSGEGSLNGLRIANPKGFSDGDAFNLGRVAIAIDPKSVTSDVVHIRSVVIDGPQLLAEFDEAGHSNLGAILDHVKKVAGGGGSGGSGGGGSGGEKRLMIDEFRFENAQARALAPAFKLDKTLKLKPLVLKNLGGRSGASASEIVQQVMRPIVDNTVKAATAEYVDARRAQLGDKAKAQAKEKLNKLFH
jgi:hypothetical protein